MTLLPLSSRIRNVVAERGLLRTFLHAGKALYRRVIPRRVPAHPFDLEHGVDTSQLIAGTKLASGHAHDAHITAYWGVQPSVFRAMMMRWQETLAGAAYAVGDYTLVDLGCGKGRAVMLASETAFQQVMGVELNPALAATAQQNLARWKLAPHACNHLAIVHEDALAVDLPETPLAIYLYNPFDEHLVQLLLDRLELLARTRRHPMDLLYLHPAHEELFVRVPGMRLLWKGALPFSAEDTAVDAFGSTRIDCAFYRLHATPDSSLTQ